MKSKSTKQTDQALLDLPNDLLKLVVSHLSLKDKMVASSVCKTLLEACGFVRFRVADKSPWLMSSYKKEDASYQLYDLSVEKIYNLKVQEIFGFEVLHSKHGWLLMYHPITHQLLFFYPFTRDRMPLPRVPYAEIMPMDFSCAPTSSSCILFSVSIIILENIDIWTCSPNAKEWNRFIFKNELPENCIYIQQIVFSNGVFYCLTNSGCLTSFDPSSNSWNILSIRPPTPPGITGCYCYMTEHQGKIFLIYRQYDNCMEPTTVLLKLDQTSWEWIEKRTLGGLTIYGSTMSYETRADQKQPNCLCFFGDNGSKRTGICAFYNIDEKRVVCIKSIDFDFFYFYGATWISPPLNLPLFDQPLY